MVVQELIAKLGFDVDNGGLQRAEHNMQQLAGVAYRAVLAFQAVRSELAGLASDAAKATNHLPNLNSMGGGGRGRRPRLPRMGDSEFIGPVVPAHLHDVKKGITVMREAAQAATPAVSQMDNGLASLASGALKMVGAAYLAKQAFDALKWGIMGAVNAASAKEDVTTQFKVMLGDLDAAKYLYQEINDYANITSYNTAEAARSVQMMMSSMSAKDAVKNMKMIGDIALGDNERMQGIARAVSQVAAKKKLQGDELMQLRERMFDPLKYLAEMRGVSQTEIEAQVQKGKLGIKDLTEAMEYATSKGHKFYKGAEEGGKTWSGLLSTAKDDLTMMGAELGEMLLPFLKEVLKQFRILWPTVLAAWRGLGEFFKIMFRDGPTAVTWAEIIAGAFRGVAYALEFLGIMWQQLVVDFEIGWAAMSIGLAMWVDNFLFLPKTFGAAILLMAKAALWFGELLAKVLPKGTIDLKGIATMKRNVNGKWDDWGLDSPLGHTSAAIGDAKQNIGGAVGKYADMLAALGHDGKDPGRLKLTDKIDKAMSDKAAKQPITNITQNNNLTVNAEDPIKTMGESAAAKFFQGAFIQLRHATV